MNNQNPVMNRSMFRKPPPNFNTSDMAQWNNFKVPTSPIKKNSPLSNAEIVQGITRNYPINPQRQTVSRNYPPNSQSQLASRNYPQLKSSPDSGSRNYPTNSQRQTVSKNYPPNSQRPLASRNYPQLKTSPDSGSRNYLTNSPSGLDLPRNYQTTPPPHSGALPPNIARHFKNEPPPNFQSRKSLSDKNYKSLVYNPVGLVQAPQFRPSIPPPPPPPQINNLSQNTHYNMSQKSDLTRDQKSSLGKEKDQLLWYCYPNHLLSLPPTSDKPPQLNLTPHHHPPLPAGAPPKNPPPPLTPPPNASPNGFLLRQSPPSMQDHMLHSRGLSPGSLQQHHFQNIANFHPRVPAPYAAPSNKHPHLNMKRKYEGNDSPKKFQKKRKKPLSQLVPQKMNWTMEDAKRALEIEKECNKRSKRQGLIIKFPDLELNRDIVASFHSSIETVHFQQPSTPRYCFVTLADSADPETVIKQLNQIPFGLGLLSAELKKDREDEYNLKASDIDPLTLYVGNLAQEITKEDVFKTYPKQKRIDIGYAKKMKYTRYAFVSFYTVDDSIEAFVATHSLQLYSKSLIVRFRRLHGTVGMPGDGKQPQMSPRVQETDTGSNPDETEADTETNPWDLDISNWDNSDFGIEDQYEPLPELDDDEVKVKPLSKLQTRLIPRYLDTSFPNHSPKVVKIKGELDEEVTFSNGEQDSGHEEYEDSFYSNISETSDMDGGAMDVQDNRQDFDDVLANMKTEKSVVKEENSDVVTTRFRVIPGTIVKPRSSFVVDLIDDNDTENCNSVKNEKDFKISTSDSHSGSSKDQQQSSSFKRERSSGCVSSRNVFIPNIDINSSIVPAPMIIKIEKDEDQKTSPTSEQKGHNESITEDRNSNEAVNFQDGSVNRIEPERSYSDSSDQQNNVNSSDKTNNTQILREDIDESARDPYSDENLSSLNVDYSTQKIKNELDADGAEDEDDDSGDDDFPMDVVLKKLKVGSKKVGANIQ